jgi:aminoglycoside phosphotransferase (APT) family kinase protein
LVARREQLSAFAADYFGNAASVRDVRRLPGHGGEGYAFDVQFAGDSHRRLVARLAPEGVKRRGNTDVLRQVPLIRALSRTSVPVAAIVAQTSNEDWFGTDAFIQEWVDGAPLHMFEPQLSVAPGSDPEPMLRSAIDVLVQLHSADSGVLDSWEQAKSVDDELATWERLIPRMENSEWSAAATQLLTRLRELDPGSHRIGIFHGDYQTNNILFDRADHGIVAVVDWELAGIGPVGLDIGWMEIMTDPGYWGEPLRDQLQLNASGSIRSWYEKAAGQSVDNYDWYVALACFRYAVISSYNVRLHRSGKRIDNFNATMAGTVPVLLRRGIDVIG